MFERSIIVCSVCVCTQGEQCTYPIDDCGLVHVTAWTSYIHAIVDACGEHVRRTGAKSAKTKSMDHCHIRVDAYQVVGQHTVLGACVNRVIINLLVLH
jgi:hypothetical protein